MIYVVLAAVLYGVALAVLVLFFMGANPRRSGNLQPPVSKDDLQDRARQAREALP